ncbi:hypothetical protein AAG906_000048 [Vitis piasezkii]
MTTNIAESFNAWLREERHQTIYTLLMMHMDKLVAMLDTHMRGTDKWKSVVGPKTEEKLMSNITRSAPITVMPYLGGTFKVFTGEVYLVVDMQQHKCTCLTWQMSGLPCPHVCAVILIRWSVYHAFHPTFLCQMMRYNINNGGNGLDGSAAIHSHSRYGKNSSYKRPPIWRSLKLKSHAGAAQPLIFLIQHFNVGFRRIEFSAQKHYPVTATDVGLIFGLPTEGRNLQVTSTSSDHPFGPIRACEEKLLDLPVGEEFRRAFIYYACATLLAPTSRLNGCRNLWHTIHEDGFRNDINWAQFVLDQLVEGIRRYQQSKTSWVAPRLAWTDDLIKRRLVAEIKEFGAFGHAEIDFVCYACINILRPRSPTVERTPEPETNVDHDTNVDAENSDQLRIMRGLMHKLGTRRHSGVNSDAGGHSSYAPASTPTADDHAFPGDEYMASHAAYHVLDTPDRVVAPEYELQPSVPINVVSGK